MIFSTSYVVFPTSNVIFGAFGKSNRFLVLPKSFERCMLFLIAHGIYAGAYGIRPLHRRMNNASHRGNMAKKQGAPSPSGFWRTPYAVSCCPAQPENLDYSSSAFAET